MSNGSVPFILVLGVLGCATPQGAPPPPPSSADATGAQLRQIQEDLSRLDNRLGHLESEVSAASAENELTRMTIDSAGWADPSTAEMFGSKTALVCHVVEWRGFGKMLRFTRLADPNFVLEADGHAPIDARMGTGGICGSDGAGRSVVLDLSRAPDPGARYRVRARNENESYRWTIPDSLVVVAPASGG